MHDEKMKEKVLIHPVIKMVNIDVYVENFFDVHVQFILLI